MVYLFWYLFKIPSMESAQNQTTLFVKVDSHMCIHVTLWKCSWLGWRALYSRCELIWKHGLLRLIWQAHPDIYLILQLSSHEVYICELILSRISTYDFARFVPHPISVLRQCISQYCKRSSCCKKPSNGTKNYWTNSSYCWKVVAAPFPLPLWSLGYTAMEVCHVWLEKGGRGRRDWFQQ